MILVWILFSKNFQFLIFYDLKCQSKYIFSKEKTLTFLTTNEWGHRYVTLSRNVEFRIF